MENFKCPHCGAIIPSENLVIFKVGLLDAIISCPSCKKKINKKDYEKSKAK